MPDKNRSAQVCLARRAEFATRADGDELVIEGYFIVFNQPYYMDDFMEEYVSSGAIDATTDTSDVRALVDHQSHLVLGRANDSVHTLDFRIDDTGLFGTVRLNASDTDAVNLHARVQRGDVDQASFGFDEDSVTYTDLPDGRVRRTVGHISKLWEISVCTFPAYEQTYVCARDRLSADAEREILRAKKQKMKRRFRHA